MKNLLAVFILFFSTPNQIENDDFKIILQKVFILETVEGYFLDMNPIYILENSETTKNKIEQLGNPFKTLSSSEIRKNNIADYIVFEKIELSKSFAKIIFRYDSEGIFAEIDLKKEKNDWIVIRQQVFER